jgi:hypothetical protein
MVRLAGACALALSALGFLCATSTLAFAEKYYVTISCCRKGDPCTPHRIGCDVGVIWSLCAQQACGYALRQRSGVKLIRREAPPISVRRDSFERFDRRPRRDDGPRGGRSADPRR